MSLALQVLQSIYEFSGIDEEIFHPEFKHHVRQGAKKVAKLGALAGAGALAYHLTQHPDTLKQYYHQLPSKPSWGQVVPKAPLINPKQF